MTTYLHHQPITDVTRATARPLFLHFLNRELGESVGVTATPERVETTVKVLLLGTTAWLYTGLSLLWESVASKGSCLRFLSSLISQDTLEVISHTGSLDDFLASRESRYRFDRPRYPMYFESTALKARSAFAPSYVKPTSATTVIDTQVRSWVELGIPGLRHRIPPALNSRVTTALLSALNKRDNRAITGSLLTPRLSRLSGVAALAPLIRRQLAFAFTADYMDTMGGDIPTGIPGLSMCDDLSKGFPIFDVPLLRLVLELLGASRYLLPRATSELWNSIRHWRNTETHSRFCLQVSNVLSAIHRLAATSGAPSLSARVALAQTLRAAAARGDPLIGSTPSLEPLWINMNTLVRSLSRFRGFAKEYELMSADAAIRSCDVLLVTATPVETHAVVERLGVTANVVHGQLRSYLELGILGGSRLALVQCEAGSVSPGASLTTVLQAMDELRPSAVILLGIAFGMDRGTQDIGQVLVSKQLELYEPARLGTSASFHRATLHRGDRATASPRLLSRFRAHAASSGLEATFGLILSGEKLLDNRSALTALRRVYPEAIGGEMEGAGLYSAARERSVDWIVVKAICDWADGTKRVQKGERQSLAAANAARFVLACIESGGFESERQFS